MPVGLLANLRLRAESEDPAVQAAHLRDLSRTLLTLQGDLLASSGSGDDELERRFANLAGPMLQLSKCPDLVVNRGHYFGSAQFNEQEGLTKDEQSFGKEPELSDEDKRALIAFLKTF